VVSPLIAERHDYSSRGGIIRSDLPGSEDNASWSLSPAPETSSLNIEAFTVGDADVVTADDIIEEDIVDGDTNGKGPKKSSESRKSARSA
jgi:hypothetical protein